MAEELISDLLLELITKERRRIASLRGWRKFSQTFDSLYRSATKGPFPFDPRFNPIHWAFDVSSLCQQIAYGLTWMNAHAAEYKSRVAHGSQPAHTSFSAQYYADSGVSRIDSCRDKLALMVWSYYCSFNPEKREEVLAYERVIERLRYPIRFGLELDGAGAFLEHLVTLGSSEFVRVGQYRDLKIHRREPRIELYGVAAHHDWPYMVALTEPKEIRDFKKRISKEFPDSNERERAFRRSRARSILFDRRTLKGRLWSFGDIAKDIESCMVKLLSAAGGCFKVLRRRGPFRTKNSSSRSVIPARL